MREAKEYSEEGEYPRNLLERRRNLRISEIKGTTLSHEERIKILEECKREHPIPETNNVIESGRRTEITEALEATPILDFEEAIFNSLKERLISLYSETLSEISKVQIDGFDSALVGDTSNTVRESNDNLETLLVENHIRSALDALGYREMQTEEAVNAPNVWCRIQEYWKDRVYGELLEKLDRAALAPALRLPIAIRLEELNSFFTHEMCVRGFTGMFKYLEKYNENGIYSSLTKQGNPTDELTVLPRTGNTLYILSQVMEVFRQRYIVESKQTHPSRFLDTLLKASSCQEHRVVSTLRSPLSFQDPTTGETSSQLLADKLIDVLGSSIEKWYQRVDNVGKSATRFRECQPSCEQLSIVTNMRNEDYAWLSVFASLMLRDRTLSKQKLIYTMIPGFGSMIGTFANDKPVLLRLTPGKGNMKLLPKRPVGIPYGVLIDLETGEVKYKYLNERILKVSFLNKYSCESKGGNVIETSQKLIGKTTRFLRVPWTEEEHSTLKRLVSSVTDRKFGRGVIYEEKETSEKSVARQTSWCLPVMVAEMVHNSPLWIEKRISSKLLINGLGKSYTPDAKSSLSFILGKIYGDAASEAIKDIPVSHFGLSSNALGMLSNASDVNIFNDPINRILGMAIENLRVDGTLSMYYGKVEPFLGILKEDYREQITLLKQLLSGMKNPGDALTQLSRCLYGTWSSLIGTDNIREQTWERLSDPEVGWLRVVHGQIDWSSTFDVENPTREWLRLKSRRHGVPNDMLTGIRDATSTEVASFCFYEDLHLGGMKRVKIDGKYTNKPLIDESRCGIAFFDTYGNEFLSFPLIGNLSGVWGTGRTGCRTERRTETVLLWSCFLNRGTVESVGISLKGIEKAETDYFNQDDRIWTQAKTNYMRELTLLRKGIENSGHHWIDFVDFKLLEDVLVASWIATKMQFTEQHGVQGAGEQYGDSQVFYRAVLSHVNRLGLPMTRRISVIPAPIESILSELPTAMLVGPGSPLLISRAGMSTPDLLYVREGRLRASEIKTSTDIVMEQTRLLEFMTSYSLHQNRPQLSQKTWSKHLERGESVVISLPFELVVDGDSERFRFIGEIEPSAASGALDSRSVLASYLAVQDANLQRIIKVMSKLESEKWEAKPLTSDILRTREHIRKIIEILAPSTPIKRVASKHTVTREIGRLYEYLLSTRLSESYYHDALLSFLMPSVLGRENVNQVTAGNSLNLSESNRPSASKHRVSN